MESDYPTLKEIQAISSMNYLGNEKIDEATGYISIEISIDPYTYSNDFFLATEEGYTDNSGTFGSYWYFIGRLKYVINTLKKDLIIIKHQKIKNLGWGDIAKEDIESYMSKFSGGPQDSEDIAKILDSECGIYEITFDKEKLQLLKDILFGTQKYLCRLKTLNFLTKNHDRVDIDEFIDFMELDGHFIFKDFGILIRSISSTNRKNVAKMYHYFFNHLNKLNQDYFVKEHLEFETEIVTGLNDNFDSKIHTKCVGIFHYNPDKDNDFKKERTKRIIESGDIVYDYETQNLIIGKIHIPFKSARKQRELLEYLLNNSDKHITSNEIGDIKQTLEDIKKRLKNEYKINEIQIKQLFNYFTSDGIEFCRILL